MTAKRVALALITITALEYGWIAADLLWRINPWVREGHCLTGHLSVGDGRSGPVFICDLRR